MSKGLFDFLADTVLDLYWTDERVGKYGEKLTEKKLKLIDLFGRKGKILKNIYVPKDNGDTSEIDLVYITQKGIFVIESKNYSGWIFGDYNSMYWTSSLPNGEKNKFYNPVKQNSTHIKWLRNYIENYSNISIPMFSIIVFSERCALKKVPEDTCDTFICKRDDLYWVIRKVWNKLPDLITDNDIASTYSILSSLTNVSEAIKQSHIDNIKCMNYKDVDKNTLYKPESSLSDQGKNEIDCDKPIICPRCGSPLVLRTAKKGINAGNQFYGCSNFPNCRFIRNT